MELPDFDPSGKGQQGTGGVPLDAPVRQALRDAGMDLISATEQPEDSPAMRDALNREADVLLNEEGAPGDAPVPAADETQEKAAPPRAEEAPAEPQTQPADDYRAKLAKAIERHGGDMEKLAGSYLSTKASLTRAEQERSAELAGLQEEIARLRAAMQRPEAPRRAETTPPEDITDDYFRENPADAVRRIVADTVRGEVIAYGQAQRNLEEQARIRQWEKENAKEIEQLQPLMRDIYLEDRSLYDRLPQTEVAGHLLRRARERDAVYKAARFYEDIRGIDNGNGEQPAAEAPMRGSLPAGTSPSSRRRSGPYTPPGGDWSQTPEFRRLSESANGGVDEMRALLGVFRQRGLGEDLK